MANRTKAVTKRKSVKVPAQALTLREQQVLRGIVAGQTNSEIGSTLGLTYETIKMYVQRISTKLGCRGKTAIAVYAVEARLVPKSE